MTAQAITLSVQVGSNGFDVARDVAVRLGYRYWDWRITSRADRTPAQPPPAEETFAGRIMGRVIRAQILEEELPPSLLAGDAQVVRDAVEAMSLPAGRRQIEETVREIARGGRAVIVGHCAQAILRDAPGVLRVLVRASPELRARSLTSQRTSLAQATEIVRQTDEIRTAFFASAYGIDWLDPSLYDLVLGMDRIDGLSAVDIVETAAHALSGATPPESLAQPWTMGAVHPLHAADGRALSGAPGRTRAA